MKREWAVALVVAMASVAALAKPLPAEDAPKPLPPLQKNFPLDQTFSLRDLNGKPISSQLDVSFKLDGAFHASGYTGCNSWSATAYPQQNQHLLVGGFAITKKTCSKENHGDRARLPARPAWARRPGISSTATSSSRGRAGRCGWCARSKQFRKVIGFRTKILLNQSLSRHSLAFQRMSLTEARAQFLP